MANGSRTTMWWFGLVRFAFPALLLSWLIACSTPPWETAPEIVRFSAEPAVIAPGETTTLSWEIEGSASLRLEPGDIDVTRRSSLTVRPDDSTSYRLVATNGAGSVERVLDVQVGVPPTVESFAADTTAVAPAESVTLSWEVVGASAVRLLPDDVDVTGASSLVVAPEASTTYRLRAANAFGVSDAEVTVLVGEVPSIVGFGAEPAVIVVGESATLSWEVVGASAVRLLPDDVDVTGASSLVVAPEVSTTYTLVASNTYGSTQDTASVTVDGTAATIESFELVSGLVNPGLDATLRWRVFGADTVELRGPGLGSGSGIEVPAVSQRLVTDLPPGATFTLLAVNPYGVTEADLVAAREVPAFSVLLAGQSNVIGRNVNDPSDALEAIRADTGVMMFGYDYLWKEAYEPLFDCTDQIDVEQGSGIDPEVSCTSFDENDAGVSPGVSLGNLIRVETGGGVYLIPRARGATGAWRWLPGADRYDRSTLFGSAAFRAQLAATQRGAPLGYAFDGRSYGAIVWYQGEANTSTFSRTVTFAEDTPMVLDAFEEELAAPVLLVQLSRRGDDAVQRNLNYQIVREQQRRYATEARTSSGGIAGESRAATHLIVTHDLPMSGGTHLSVAAQIELGRRLSLAIRQHLLGEAVDGSGPRLVSVEKDSDSVVRVRTDRPITAPASNGPEAYGGYFAVIAGGAEQPIATIERDATDSRVVRITLVGPVAGSVSVRYMPPPVTLSRVAADVIRSADCAEPMPDTTLCLPMAAFGAAMDTATVSALRLFVDEDDDPEGY